MSAEPVIAVEHLGKRYKLGGQRAVYATFRETLTETAKAPLRWIKGLPKEQPNIIWALADVSFEIMQGETVGIIGRNGAGKSTLLKVLSRITWPTCGRVKISGRVGSLLEVGTGFHSELTGRENIFLNGAILGMSRKEIMRKFEEIVAFAEIEKFLDTPVKFYSSGMYVRLAFAVAAHLEPEILIVDEVLAVGDAQFQKKCLGKMGTISREGRTVLFVSHNMAAIKRICSRGIWINQGRIIEQGAIDMIVDKYLSADVTGFSSTVALAKTDNEFGNGLRLQIASSAGVPKAQFKLNEPWRIRFEFELTRPVPHLIAGIGICTIDSIPLVTYWSKPGNRSPGKYKVEFEVDLPLKACELQFSVGLSNYERPFYFQERVGLVSISEVATNEQPFRSIGAGILLSAQTEEIEPLDG